MPLAVPLDSPLLWAVLVLWIMTVVLHEFAHGVVAYWGGDYTIKERGGLSLNPLQYIDPVGSLLLPAVFLMMGGVPLPGGVTYIRRDLLRSRGWDVAVSAAGPAMNFILFFVFVLPLHPSVGWVDRAAGAEGWTDLQKVMAAMAILQMIAVLLNLVPVPPLDGFQMLSPFLDEPTRVKLSTPPLSMMLFIGFFVFIIAVGVAQQAYDISVRILDPLGFDWLSQDQIRQAFNLVMTGRESQD